MRFLLGVLVVMLSGSLLQGQNWDADSYVRSYSVESYGRRPLADLNANQYDQNSLRNPYGAGNPYRADGLMNQYGRYGSPYSNDSWRNPYGTNPPRMSNGGEFSMNRYRQNSTSNPYGRFGSPYSRDSLRNPYGAGNPYSNRPMYVWPSRR
jgi:hypothetical protein